MLFFMVKFDIVIFTFAVLVDAKQYVCYFMFSRYVRKIVIILNSYSYVLKMY